MLDLVLKNLSKSYFKIFMKTIYIYKSEMNNAIHVCSDDNLDEFNKKRNKEITVSSELKIKPWEQICHFVFKRAQSANNFEQFLKTENGSKFIDEQILPNPLTELKKLLKTLPKTCEFYVMGGLALDGHLGKISRVHNDVDLICWRKDVSIFRKALGKIGYKVREHCIKDRPNLPRLLETDEEYPMIEVKIIDEQPNNYFQFHINCPGEQIYKKKLLGPKQVSLNGLKFPAISLELIDVLSELNRQNLKNIKKENPKLYKVLENKIDNAKSDGKIIKQLLNK